MIRLSPRIGVLYAVLALTGMGNAQAKAASIYVMKGEDLRRFGVEFGAAATRSEVERGLLFALKWMP